MLKESTHIAQKELANYCRTDQLGEIPGLTDGRVHHYRRLIFNIVLDTLRTAYPLTKDLLGQKNWRKIVHQFFSSYACTEPQVWKIPKDFLDWVEQTELAEKTQYPHFSDLVYFEWIELEMYMMEDIRSSFKEQGDLLNDYLVLNPESKILILDFPVHNKNANEINEYDRGKYYCLAFREPVHCKIRFIDLSGLYALVIEQLYKDTTLKEVVQMVSIETGMEVSLLSENLLPFMKHLQKEGFVLGFT